MVAIIAIAGILVYKLFIPVGIPWHIKQTPLLLASPSTTPDLTSGWATYSGKDFSFKYPPGWTQNSLGSADRKSTIITITPSTTLDESLDKSGYINIDISNYDNQFEIDRSFVSLYGKGISDLGFESVRIGEQSALKGSNLSTFVDKNIQEEVIILQRGYTIYRFNLITNKLSDNTVISSVFDKILSTFRLLTPTPSPTPYQSCDTDSNCQNGAKCEVTGPLIANQPVHKVCVPPGFVVPN